MFGNPKEGKFLDYKRNPEISKIEPFSTDFQNNIKNIWRIYFTYGHCFDHCHDYYVVELSNDESVLRYTIGSENERESGKVIIDKDNFFKDLYSLNIGKWKKNCMYCHISEYEEQYYLGTEKSMCILDGYSWDLSISYSGGLKKISFNGSNFYPRNYTDLKGLFRKLTANEAIQKQTYEEYIYELLKNLYI